MSAQTNLSVMPEPAPCAHAPDDLATVRAELAEIRQAVQELSAAVREFIASGDHALGVQAWDEVLRAGYKTNDLVVLDGQTMFVNGIGPIGLDRREAVLIRLLAEFARGACRHKHLFLATARIVEMAERWFPHAWNQPDAADVFAVVNRLRRKLAKRGLNKCLIENSPGDGYRLSTPVWNLRLADQEAPASSGPETVRRTKNSSHSAS